MVICEKEEVWVSDSLNSNPFKYFPSKILMASLLENEEFFPHLKYENFSSQPPHFVGGVNT